ncbi:peptide chain release factor 1-like, mitochondrial [Macrobrachium nipponense]|uniref:peptide chain release factor 1-like, mitochondrial n=1 Tax=Macrobrachium nipponense TaxID=159736 RepID=UPI0030C7ADD5
MMGVQNKNFQKLISLVTFMSKTSAKNSSRQSLPSCLRIPHLWHRNFYTSSPLATKYLLSGNGELSHAIATGAGNKLLFENCNVCGYSSSTDDYLSLSNVNVQRYLLHLKNSYLQATKHADQDSMKIIRNLKDLMDAVNEMERLQTEIEELQELAKDISEGNEMQQLADSDLKDAKDRLQSLEEKVLIAMVPSEPLDDTDITIEVSAGVGGQEAMLFCREIFEMYQNYANFMGWEMEVTEFEKTDLGGLRHGSANISGKSVYRHLKYEGGTHRVQRVPKTERAGRIHTSTVSVAVMPQPTEIDIQISPKDLKIETKRASGAGGQHVNTTDSAVRISHIPSGIVVESQTERSQHRNKDECMQKLRALLYQKQLDESNSQYSSSRKLQVGTKGRSEKIRTYNYPQDRVTDHRIGVSVHNLPSLLDGSDLLHTLVCKVMSEADKENVLEVIENFNAHHSRES